MKILFFVENNHCGGMDSFFANVINHWPHPEDELCLICNEGHPGLPNIQQAAKRECEFIAHDIPLNWEVVDRHFKWLPAIARRLLRPILRIVLFTHQMRRLRRLFREASADRLLVVNGAYPGGESCRLANIAWVHEGGVPGVHNIRNFAIAPRPLFGWYENWVDRKLEASVSAFVGVSRCCAESLRLRPALAESGKIHHIYNGVATPSPGDKDSHPMDLRAETGIGDAPLCLMLATYEPRKGHAFLFRAFREVNARFPEAHLVICGDGAGREKADVEALRRDIAPEANIHLLDFIPGGSKLISQADMLIVASQEWESFGWTVIESMVRGVPVVSTNAGGLAEVVGTNGIAGYSIDPADVEGFAAAIIELVGSDEKRHSIGEAGRARAAEMFTVERMAREYAQFIRAPGADGLVE